MLNNMLNSLWVEQNFKDITVNSKEACKMWWENYERMLVFLNNFHLNSYKNLWYVPVVKNENK